MIWRWDQGRTQYFNFQSIQKISKILLKYNGANMQVVDSTFRDDLMQNVGLPFAPPRYTIKRNYKRVFECAMLATYIGNRLIISEIGRAIANEDAIISTPDGYLYEVERRFRYPYPAFNNYTDVRTVSFPFLAMLKLLFAKALRDGNTNATITIDDIGEYLIANESTGLEDLDYYWGLEPKNFSFASYSSSDQKRQVREMMAFIGQHSYLSYRNSTLALTGISLEECESAFSNLSPYDTEITSQNVVDDFLKLTAYSTTPSSEERLHGSDEDMESLEDFSVTEGKKVFKSHFSRERDSELRKEFIKNNPDPVCDICARNMHIVYPWTENMLEIHHLLPLSSGQEDSRITSLDDVVGICPSCHRAVHIYYKRFLQDKGRSDFTSNEEALLAYMSAKAKVVKE